MLFGRCLKYGWKVCGRCLEGLWKVVVRCLASVLMAWGKFWEGFEFVGRFVLELLIRSCFKLFHTGKGTN